MDGKQEKTRVMILRAGSAHTLENAINTSIDSIETLHKGKIVSVAVVPGVWTLYKAIITYKVKEQ